MAALTHTLGHTLAHTPADTSTMASAQNQRVARIIAAQETRLRAFIRRQVIDRQEAEDILQDVFHELIDAYRLMKPIEQVGAWLFRVARNRIIDRFRRQRHEVSASEHGEREDSLRWDDLLPTTSGPEAEFARDILLEEIEQAITELPAAQQEVFVAHELEGRSFKELAAQSGVSVNALLSRKHAAVAALRERLAAIYQEFNESGDEP